MPHGTPDWGLTGPKETVYGMDDEGEAAVRLGSPHFFDRRGDVLHITDFREGLGALEDMSAVGEGNIGLYTGHSRTGSFALGLQGGDEAEEEASLGLRLPIPVMSNVGLETTFSLDPSTHFIYWELLWYDLVTSRQGMVRYDNQLQRSEYLDAGGLWQVIAGAGALQLYAQPIHTLKMVVDLVNAQYVRVLIDNNTYLLTGVGVRLIGPGALPHLLVEIEHFPVDGTEPIVYLDNFILTQNEPPWQG